METKDAWLLLASIPLSYLAGLLTTFTAPPLSNAFGKLKSGFIERNRARALASYAVVQDLRSGKWDKYLYSLDSWGFILVHLLFGLASGIIGVLTNDPIVRVSTMAVSVLATLMSIRRTAHLFLTRSRMNNFDDYRAELLRRWPDIVLPE
jgi:hypothetical protein